MSEVARPGWYRITWFLGRPPALTARQWRVLGLVSIVSLFEQYDLYLFSLNLKQIQQDLAIDDGQLGFFGSIVRAGALLALPIALAADRFGRRRLLLLTVVAYTALTGATAFVPDATSFVVVQFLARGFATAETLLAIVVIAEEFAPQHRGWGIGALGAIQACGAGLASALFGFVEVLPFGWRSLYLVGLAPLVLVAWWRRTLPETDRFEQLQARRTAEFRAAPAMAPVVALVRDHALRFWALGGVVVLVGSVAASASFFAPKYLQDVHGWTPAWVAALSLFGGMFAIIGNPLAGWMSDRGGRRPVTVLFAAGFAVVTFVFYSWTGVFAPALWIALIFTMMGTDVTVATYGAELFPTSLRSTASGARAALRDGGGIAGLALVSLLFPVFGSNWSVITLLCLFCLVVPLIVWLVFPETTGRSLEEIAPERRAADLVDNAGKRDVSTG